MSKISTKIVVARMNSELSVDTSTYDKLLNVNKIKLRTTLRFIFKKVIFQLKRKKAYK
jgi:hypothetical protein